MEILSAYSLLINWRLAQRHLNANVKGKVESVANRVRPTASYRRNSFNQAGAVVASGCAR